VWADEAVEELDLPSEFTHKNDRAIGIDDFELLKVRRIPGVEISGSECLWVV
jgi:hypothetical protein